VCLLAVVLVLGLAAPAAADPPRPTDFATEVVGVDPPVDGVVVRLLGGDSFLEIAVERGIELTVTGYRGEPFVRYRADGTVEEDTASYTSLTSQSRYGSNVAAEVGATPTWTVVARDGSWAWHDHRAHWMSPQNPPGRGPGDQVLEGVVPLVVDGRAVKLQLATWWVSPPPARHGAVGVAVGLLVGAAVLLGARDPRRRHDPIIAAAPALLAALAALAVGLATRRGLPAEAAPSSLHWLLPLLGLAAAGAAAGLRRRPERSASAALLASVSLLQWVWWRRDVLTKPVLPTSAPFGLDRATTAAVAVVAVVALFVAATALARALRPAQIPPPAPATVHA
jgi:hypothetical protein